MRCDMIDTCAACRACWQRRTGAWWRGTASSDTADNICARRLQGASTTLLDPDVHRTVGPSWIGVISFRAGHGQRHTLQALMFRARRGATTLHDFHSLVLSSCKDCWI